MKKYVKIAGAGCAVVVVIAIAIVVLLLWLFFGVLLPYYNTPESYKPVVDYTQDQGLVSNLTYEYLMNSENSAKYALGVNDDGKVVFYHPYKAFGAAKKEFKACWKYADKELDYKHLSRTFYVDYANMSVEDIEATIAANEGLTMEQFTIYKEILTIYQNSYKVSR